jgi:protein-arginine kinase activator protein McsA
VFLFTNTLQGIDAIYHIETDSKKENCVHLSKVKTQITHSHHGIEHCKICDFTFSNFIYTNQFALTFKKISSVSKHTVSYSQEITQFFKGALYSLRAPPIFID